jgi:putative sterol carrier protein
MSLETLEQTFRARLSDFAGLGARVVFDLGEDGTLAVDATVSPPSLSRDETEADCTIRVSAADLEKLAAGDLNPMLAYTLGRLKVDGSMGIAMKVAALLEE